MPNGADERAPRPLRIAWLTPGITGFLDACLRALHDRGTEQLIVLPESNREGGIEFMRDTAWDTEQLFRYAEKYAWRVPPGTKELAERLAEFRPDAVVSATWSRPKGYRGAVRVQPPEVLRILYMDNIWRASPRQWLGRLTHRLYIDPIFDCVMVASDRSEWFARRLGFAAEDVIRGGATADTALFDRGPRAGSELARNRSFLFVGRLVEHKGVDVLATAYSRYRQLTPDPWELHVVGMGPLRSELAGLEGVVLHDFLNPPELTELMHRCSCLLLPSHLEPYGIVVHEATAAGLPVLVSDWVGAAPGLVQDNSNGWVVAAGRADLWSSAMARISGLPPERLGEMSAVSNALSRRLSPEAWAQNLHEEIARRIPGDRMGR